MNRFFAIAGSLAAMTAVTNADIIGLVDFDGTELGLISYSNTTYVYGGTGLGTDALQVSSDAGTTSDWSPGDAFWPMTRAAVGPNTIGMPFAISDDGVVPAAGNTLFETDNGGFAGVDFENDGFFGVTDTENGLNTGLISADFEFDVAGATNLSVSVDIAAMGDFEAADLFNFEYSVDGGSFQPLFTSSIDEDIDQTYIMDNPDTLPVVLNDPAFIDGVILDDNYQTFTAAIPETGSTLTVRFSAQTDGSEGFGFDNLTVEGDTGTPGLVLTLESSCPASGPAVLTATGGGSGVVAFVYSLSGTGSFIIPGGFTCAGTELGLAGPVTLGGTASGDPAVLNVGNVPAAACGRAVVQALTTDTCETSNTVSF